MPTPTERYIQDALAMLDAGRTSSARSYMVMALDEAHRSRPNATFVWPHSAPQPGERIERVMQDFQDNMLAAMQHVEDLIRKAENA